MYIKLALIASMVYYILDYLHRRVMLPSLQKIIETDGVTGVLMEEPKWYHFMMKFAAEASGVIYLLLSILAAFKELGL